MAKLTGVLLLLRNRENKSLLFLKYSADSLIDTYNKGASRIYLGLMPQETEFLNENDSVPTSKKTQPVTTTGKNSLMLFK
jgi:hypothetical protein